ncbi:MAG: 3-oxoacyl-ACP synthase [Rickettsiales bacterium]|nr:3-oxoacyl-ACP synthase [Rickettsiales bacterium]|tara:strand:+ start:1225 stop:2187 length:963 start_codon:yes stop_codon:yes gene_type:complete
MINSRIIGFGHYLPKKILTNADMSKIVDTNDEWILSRTGISQRHIAEKNELTSDLATKACKNALDNSKLQSSDIDCVIVATTTPDQTFPSTACKIQSCLNMGNKPAFDIQAVCSGFIYSLELADALIKSKKANNILVVGAETLSKIVDWKDRRTCVLFGDGAGAVVISADHSSSECGILSTNLFSDGSWHDSLYADGGPSLDQKVGKIRMKGKDIFKQAVTKLSESTLLSLKKSKKNISQIDWYIPHQANLRIINGSAKKLGICKNKVIKTVNLHANTSAASIPLALSSCVLKGKIKKNSLIALCAIGGGLTWGSCILKI